MNYIIKLIINSFPPPGLFVFWVNLLEPSRQISAEAQYTLHLVGFSTGCTGCLLSLVTMTHTDWRLWLIKKNNVYSTGIARVGIWQICFPPYLNASTKFHTLCCHRFTFFETFMPVEMKVGQILIVTASLFAFWGLLFSFATPWNFFYLVITPIRAWWAFVAGGIFYVISGICIFVPISWNVYSVSVNASIRFPESFNLPLRPTAQRNGSAIYLGYTSGALLLISGVCLIILRSLTRPARIVPV